jgi:nitronate monooxygenase
MGVIVEHRVPIVITSLGARREINDAVHSYGGVVLHDVISNEFARKAIDKGADGIIAVAAGAGGHAGTQSPLALIREIREWFDGPLLLSGAIAHGRSILAALAAGADFAYIGSAFLSTAEANAAPAYKQMIVNSTAKDIVYSNLFTGVHGNYLRGSVVAAGLDPDDLPESDPSAMDFGTGGNMKAKAWRDVWGSGQGIGALKEMMSVAELVVRLKAQYDEARRSLAATVLEPGFSTVA